MSVSSNSAKSNNVGDSLAMNSIINDLESATKKIHSIKKRFNEMQDDVKVDDRAIPRYTVHYKNDSR